MCTWAALFTATFALSASGAFDLVWFSDRQSAAICTHFISPLKVICHPSTLPERPDQYLRIGGVLCVSEYLKMPLTDRFPHPSVSRHSPSADSVITFRVFKKLHLLIRMPMLMLMMLIVNGRMRGAPVAMPLLRYRGQRGDRRGWRIAYLTGELPTVGQRRRPTLRWR